MFLNKCKIKICINLNVMNINNAHNLKDPKNNTQACQFNDIFLHMFPHIYFDNLYNYKILILSNVSNDLKKLYIFIVSLYMQRYV